MKLKKEAIRMRKKRQHFKKDKQALHRLGGERFIHIQRYIGDLPSEEPVDWFEQAEETEPEFLIGTDEVNKRSNR
jgi:hypothetical protein